SVGEETLADEQIDLTQVDQPEVDRDLLAALGFAHPGGILPSPDHPDRCQRAGQNRGPSEPWRFSPARPDQFTMVRDGPVGPSSPDRLPGRRSAVERELRRATVQRPIADLTRLVGN